MPTNHLNTNKDGGCGVTARRTASRFGGRVLQAMGAYPGERNAYEILVGLAAGLRSWPPATGAEGAYLAGHEIGAAMARSIERGAQ